MSSARQEMFHQSGQHWLTYSCCNRILLLEDRSALGKDSEGRQSEPSNGYRQLQEVSLHPTAGQGEWSTAWMCGWVPGSQQC